MLMFFLQVSVQMMYKKKNVDVYFDQAINTSVLHLPFNSSYSMLLLLPDNMETLENAISPGHLTKWLKWMKSRLGNCKVTKNLGFYIVKKRLLVKLIFFTTQNI